MYLHDIHCCIRYKSNKRATEQNDESGTETISTITKQCVAVATAAAAAGITEAVINDQSEGIALKRAAATGCAVEAFRTVIVGIAGQIVKISSNESSGHGDSRSSCRNKSKIKTKVFWTPFLLDVVRNNSEDTTV